MTKEVINARDGKRTVFTGKGIGYRSKIYPSPVLKMLGQSQLTTILKAGD
jgi:hypothetical protein